MKNLYIGILCLLVPLIGGKLADSITESFHASKATILAHREIMRMQVKSSTKRALRIAKTTKDN